MNKPQFELADIFRSGFPSYIAQTKSLPIEQYKVANALVNCHTAALGGHLFKCNECSHTKIAYNSCRNRHCPSCQAFERAHWVEKRGEELLPVSYFHVVFTVPSELNPFALRNKKAFYSILFKAAADTLQACAQREKYLGAQIGIIAILHTWGQNLLDHPHLHCVVPAGGIRADKTMWLQTPNTQFLFPVAVVSKLFRGKFLGYFREALDSGEIAFHGTLNSYEQEPSTFRRLLDYLYNQKWVVYLKPPFAGSQAVLKYLGRYTHRIAISNSRITDVNNETVSFSWKDYADNNRNKTMTLSRHEFIRRFLLHVLPIGFVRIRYFGFLSLPVRNRMLPLCRKLAATKTPDLPKKRQVQHAVTPAIKPLWKCPACRTGLLMKYRQVPRPYHRTFERTVAT